MLFQPFLLAALSKDFAICTFSSLPSPTKPRDKLLFNPPDGTTPPLLLPLEGWSLELPPSSPLLPPPLAALVPCNSASASTLGTGAFTVDTGYAGHKTRPWSSLQLWRVESVLAISAMCWVRAAVGRETTGTRGSGTLARACRSSSIRLSSRDFGFLERVA